MNRSFHDKKLESRGLFSLKIMTKMMGTELAKAGLGVHHAGLSLDDRRSTEELFLGGTLRIICATSVR